MKTATDQPAEGQVIETTTRKRVLPAEPSQDRSTPELWPYLQSLNSQLGEWDRHIVYLYRSDPGGPGNTMTPVGKFTRVIQLPDNTIVPLDDQEEVEFAIARTWGGRAYRIIVKRDSQRICEGRVYVDAPPKAIVPQADHSGATVIPMPSSLDATAQIAGKAIDTIAGQERAQTQITIDALNTAANIVRSMGEGRSAGGDDLTRQMMTVMINRMLQPPPDPLDLLTKVLALTSALNPQGGGGGMTGKLLDAAIDKFLNPVAAGPAISAGAELVRTLPSVANSITDGVREWRMGMEAQRDGVMAMRAPVAPGSPVAANAVTAPPQVLAPRPNPTPPANGVAPVSGAPSLEFIETRIVEILKQPMSAEEAAERALEFLHTIDGENPAPEKSLVGQLVSAGETGLLQLFGARAILKQATANMPRLLEFIRAFLKFHAEDQAEEGKGANDRKPN